MSNWNKYEKAAEKGPFSIFIKLFGLIIAISIVIGVTGTIFGWFGEAADVVQEEFGPRTAMDKYEWFIGQASAIEKMDKDISLFESRVESIESSYAGYGENKTQWPIDIRTTYNHEISIARDDLVAVISQRNNLVKEYNAASEKFNWAPFKTKLDKPREAFQEYRSNN